MTTRSINEQIRAIQKATEKASESKESAIAFLRQAGIISNSVAARQTQIRMVSSKK